MNDKKLNSRQKCFVLYLASGMSQTDAYIKAGYSPDGADANASKLITIDKISQEIDRLHAKTESKALTSVMQPLERRQRLSEIAKGCLVDFLDEQGEPRLNKDTPNNGAAREYSTRVRSDRDGNITTSRAIKLNNPVEAIQELNKMGGDYAPSKHLVAGRVIFEVVHIDKTKQQEEEPEAVDDR